MLRDLIQILILRELLRRNQRPPMPPPPRPQDQCNHHGDHIRKKCINFLF